MEKALLLGSLGLLENPALSRNSRRLHLICGKLRGVWERENRIYLEK